MARFARIVASGLPHHVTQRVSGRVPAFRSAKDYALYLDMLAAQAKSASAEILAYCLLPRTIHLIVVPRGRDGLRLALATANKRYARHANAARGRGGKMWHGRFASFPLDEEAVTASARFIELAPVREGLAASARGWRWSSA
ncbi:MAG: transposase, partial [Alphaproteobacteria bacterium]|nr:transposase [Alphaproteobacteria bacterium]